MKYRLLVSILLLPFLSFAGTPHRAHSVLASGKWYRVALTRTGIFRITYEDLDKMGLNPASVNPGYIRVFGNGGGMLSESNMDPRPDDLRETSIEVVGGDDGHFDPGDYILFYGEGPDSWTYDNTRKIFNHNKHLYCDSSYYFINADLGPGKRVQPRNSCDSAASYYSHYLADYAFHEQDSESLAQTGKFWWGEIFSTSKNDYSFHFDFPHIDTVSPAYITTWAAAYCSLPSKFILIGPGGIIDSLLIESTDPNSLNIVAREKKKNSLMFHPVSSFDLNLVYNIPTATSSGWLNYIEVNCQRRLIWTGPQMPFRDVNNIGPGKVSEFDIQEATQDMKVWDITFRDDIRRVMPLSVDSVFRFRAVTDTLRQFIAYDGSFYYPVQLSGPVDNQDLHGMEPADLVIVTNPLFLSQANTLADFHRNKSGLTVDVATTTQVYQEFSSGMQDVSAIRDFVKMLYDKGLSSGTPRYLLLFGDGSFDPKNRISHNINMIPTFQSSSSLNTYASYVTDDFYGIMGDHEGYDANGSIEIGVGRFPVNTVEDADIMVNKIIEYSDTTGSEMSDWKNAFTFVADDENANLHLHQAETLIDIVESKYPTYNINKIFLDAYPFEKTPTGDRDPQVNQAINDAVNKGTIILNYTGHGGETGWAVEKVLTFDDINTWKNQGRLPVFITATCEFSRFDNPQRITGGELILLKKDGGAIALYSTTRAAFATANLRLDSSFFMHLISPPGEPNPTMGDLLRISKNNNDNIPSIRNFELLGDPAQQIIFPKNNVVTTTINGKDIQFTTDTVMGLSVAQVTGQVQDWQGNVLDNFNGTLQAKVFDKPVTYVTLGNTSGSYPEEFLMQNRLLSDGKISVKNGKFSFGFVVPKEIGLNFGAGKISYYAHSDGTDANGFDDHIIIGGMDPGIDPENAGPEIKLYMDNTNFVSGGQTGRNPVMLAFLKDTNGINTLDLGIGHEILCILDDNTSQAIVMNDYYDADIDNWGSGSINYQFTDLPIGRHTLKLQAWDLYDNSSFSEITFFVFEGSEMTLSGVYNSPNPFRDGTTFHYIPDPRSGKESVEIEIFNNMGVLVKTIDINIGNFELNPLDIYWDGTNDHNVKLNSGLYVYRFIVKNTDGAISQTTQKLVIVR